MSVTFLVFAALAQWAIYSMAALTGLALADVINN